MHCVAEAFSLITYRSRRIPILQIANQLRTAFQGHFMGMLCWVIVLTHFDKHESGIMLVVHLEAYTQEAIMFGNTRLHLGVL